MKKLTLEQERILRQLTRAFIELKPNWSQPVQNHIENDLQHMRELRQDKTTQHLWYSVIPRVTYTAAVSSLSIQPQELKDLRTAAFRRFNQVYSEQSGNLTWGRLENEIKSFPDLPEERKSPIARNPQGGIAAPPPPVRAAPPPPVRAAPLRAPAAVAGLNAYQDQGDLDYNGGEQIRSLYCGLGQKPPGWQYGNRLQCLRKGFAVGRRKIST